MKMPAHQLACIGERDFAKPFIHVLPAFFIERFRLLMLGGKSLHWLNRLQLLKVASSCEILVRIFSPFGDCSDFFDVDHVETRTRQMAITDFSLPPMPMLGKLGSFFRAFYARRR
jgi:hypothetical protein